METDLRIEGPASPSRAAVRASLGRPLATARAWAVVPSTGLVAGLAAAGVAAASATVALAATSDHLHEPGVFASLSVWITLPSVFAGLVAWTRRPDSRFGPLMVAAGFANFASTLSWANEAVPLTLGQALDMLPPVLFLHVFLAYPSGRLERRLERWIVTVGYAAAVGLELVRMFLGEFGRRNLFEVVSESDSAVLVRHAQLVLISALALAGLAVLALRWREATPAFRRVLAPVIAPGALVLVLIPLLLVSATFSGPHVETVRRLTFGALGAAPVFFLFGLLRSRLAVRPLVLSLGGATAPGEVRDALARALRDPSLLVAYWLPESGHYVDAEGRRFTLPDQEDDRGLTPVEHDGRRIALLVHDASLADEPERLEAVAAAATLALENERLHAEVRASLAEIAESRARIVRAGDDERRRLERNLHDGAQQQLLALSVSLSLLESRVTKDPEAFELMRTARGHLTRSLEELRELARGIHPAVLSDHGLEVALEAVAARAPLPVRLDVVSERLPEQVEVAAYYLVSEALTNIAKHAHASAASVVVERRGRWALVEIADDGVGGAVTTGGSGLRGLADRVEALAGRLAIESARGSGTRVSAEIPCA